MLPNFLLLTGYRDLTKKLWVQLQVEKTETFHHEHIPVIESKDYTWEKFREATNDWRSPAVVRGLFNDVPAVKKWAEKDYLSNSILANHKIPIIKRGQYGDYQNSRYVGKFGEACDKVISSPAGTADSQLYIFFPVKSRHNTAGAAEGAHESLVEAVEKITQEDLRFDEKIWPGWPGFGDKTKHKTYMGSQIIIGRGTNDSESTTGTGWHCAPGSNFFVQVVGEKIWYFLEPKYSSGLRPLRGGMVNMMTGHATDSAWTALHQHLPMRTAHLLPGDMLYNPDWQWHTIKNKEGLSIGVPIREANLSLSFRNNFLYTSVIVGNKLREKFGMAVPGLLEEVFEDEK